jgi:hypothetical protein
LGWAGRVRAGDWVYNTTHQNQNQHLSVQKTKISKLNQIKTKKTNLKTKSKPQKIKNLT